MCFSFGCLDSCWSVPTRDGYSNSSSESTWRGAGQTTSSSTRSERRRTSGQGLPAFCRLAERRDNESTSQQTRCDSAGTGPEVVSHRNQPSTGICTPYLKKARGGDGGAFDLCRVVFVPRGGRACKCLQRALNHLQACSNGTSQSSSGSTAPSSSSGSSDKQQTSSGGSSTPASARHQRHGACRKGNQSLSNPPGRTKRRVKAPGHPPLHHPEETSMGWQAKLASPHGIPGCGSLDRSGGRWACRRRKMGCGVRDAALPCRGDQRGGPICVYARPVSGVNVCMYVCKGPS